MKIDPDRLADELARDAKRLGLGATGRYPAGRLNDDDEGELKAAIALDRKNQRLLINFGKPITFLAMTADEALGLAEVIHRKAAELKGATR